MNANSQKDLELEVTTSDSQNTKDYSSLTDINKIPLFTDEFNVEKQKKLSNDKKETSKINKEIFCAKLDSSDDSINMNQLFLSESQPYIKPEEHNNQVQNSIIFPITGIVMVTFLFFMIKYCQKRKRILNEKLNKMGQEEWNEK